MIVVGYYGLGKSSVCEKNPGFIDLESKYFRGDDTWIGKDKEGLDRYIWLIEDLNAQGKTVFVSSNLDVRKKIFKSDRINSYESVAYIYPSIDIKDQWLSRLYNRWKESALQKDWYAYKRATRSYEEDISSISNDIGKSMYYLITKDNINSFNLEDVVKRLAYDLERREDE